MNGWTEAQLDWARHSIRLTNDRLNAEPERSDLSALDRKRLRWLVGQQQTVLERVAKGLVLDGVLGPVARYLRAYADLHIDWYGGQMDGQTFRRVMLDARQRLEDELKLMREGIKDV